MLKKAITSQLSFITPVELLEEFGQHSDFLFVEADIFLKSSKLRKYAYRWSSKTKKETVLDNSAFLLDGESIALDKLKKVVKLLKPTRVILPDKFNDWRGTLNRARTAIPVLRKAYPKVKFIGVPQGSTPAEWFTCATVLVEELAIDVLGITMALPSYERLKVSSDDLLSRIQWLKAVCTLLDSNIWKTPTHLLGLMCPEELAHIKHLNQLGMNIKYNDSGFVFQAASVSFYLEEGWNEEMPKVRTPFFASWNENQREIVDDNITYVRSLLS